jgi:photosystem II stability/assembly factor-like uncharacterized protein
MKRISLVLSLFSSLNLGFHGIASSQESTVYIAVVATRLFVVGAANPKTGIYFQQPSRDTVWQHTGPNNFRAFGVAVHRPSGGRVLYIAAGNGLHKSTDGGATWRITTDWRVTEVLWVSPDQRDLNRVYIATAYGIYKTEDGCKTWTQVNRGLVSTFTPCVIVDHADSRTLYCATEEGGYRSDDGAETWKRMGLSVDGVRVIAQHPTNRSVLIAGTEGNGIYSTQNGGTWWTKSEAGIDHTTFYTFAFNPINPDVVYAGGYVTGVYKSVDGGNSWKRVNNGLTSLNIHSLAVDPADGERVFAAAYWGGVFRTDNGGASWRNVGHSDSQVWTVLVESQ